MLRNPASPCLAAPIVDAPSATPRRVVRRVSSPSVPLDADTLAIVRALIGRDGLPAASRALQMPPSTIASAAAGATLRNGTRLLLTQRLAALAKGDAR